MPGVLFFLFAVALVVFFRWVNILAEYERGVIFRLGRLIPQPKGPGIVLVFWPVDRMPQCRAHVGLLCALGQQAPPGAERPPRRSQRGRRPQR